MKRIKVDKGSMAPVVIVVAIIAMVFFAFIWEWGRFNTIAGQVDRDVKASVNGIVSEQWDVVYQGVREGYAGAYTKNDNDAWKELVRKKHINEQLIEMMDYTKNGNILEKKDAEGRIIYSVTLEDVEVDVTNTQKGDLEGKALTVATEVTITIPWTFLAAYGEIPPVVINKTVKGGFTPKF